MIHSIFFIFVSQGLFQGIHVYFVRLSKGRNIRHATQDFNTLKENGIIIVLATDDEDISEGPSDRSPPQSVPTGKIKC